MTDLMVITVAVPRSRISEMYRICSEWIQEFEVEEVPSGAKEWEQEDPSSLHDAQLLYWSLSDRAKEIVDVLIDINFDYVQFGNQVATLDFINHLEFRNPAQVSGTLSSVDRRVKSMGRAVPYDYDREGSYYWMDRETAEVFKRAREAGPLKRGRTMKARKEVPTQEEE